MEWLDLVMDNGELVRIEYKSKYMDEIYESIDNARKRSDWWSPSMFEDASAEYMGIRLDRVDMKRVIGMM